MRPASPLLLWLLVCVVALLGIGPDWAKAEAAFARTDRGHEYYRFDINEDKLAGAPDQSALNRALNRADQVFVNGRHFYTVGPDATPHTSDDQRIRLFGMNLSFAANFPAPHRAAAMAKRLRKLGVNAVRLHHLDSLPGEETSPPRSILTSGPYPTFNPAAIHRLKTFIAALSAEGIYINLNLRVGYRFRPEIDGLPALDNQRTRPASVGTPIHVYYPPLIERQERYARELIKALGLINNPVLAMVEINNESSLLAAWQGDAWYGDTWHNTIPSAYGHVLQVSWKNWILKRYGALEAACKAWDTCDDPDIAALPATTISGAGSAHPSVSQRISNRLARLGRDLGWQTDDPDSPDHAQRYKYDFLSFLTDQDRAYFNHMKAFIRQVTGTPVPITGTQMTYGGVMNLDSHRDMDYIDDHVYVGHHVYADGNPWQSTDWRVQDISASGAGMARLLGLSLRRDHAKPFVISEFNQPFPTPGGSEILPLMVAVASLQDWDGLFFYRYDDSLDTKAAPWYFSLSGDWGKYALTGQSARLFRQFLIPALNHQTPLPLPEHDRLFLATQGHIRTLTLERHLEDRFGLPLQAAWATQLSQHVHHNASPVDASALSGKTDFAAPANPSVKHVEDLEHVILDTEHAWGFFGKLQKMQTLNSGPFTLRLDHPPEQAIQALITPLDQHSIHHSTHLLLSLGGDTTGTQPGSIPARPKALIPYPGKPGWLTLEPDPLNGGRSAMLSAQPPAWIRRADIQVRLPYPLPNLTIYPLNGLGQRQTALPSSAFSADEQKNATWVRLQGRAETASPWYEIVITPKSISPKPQEPK